MLHIAICDDEKDFIQYLTGLLNQYSKETGRNIKITPYYDGMELIEKYDPTIDLIFLDIQMKMVDGLHAAERIRQMDETVGIIFLTTLTQYGLEGYVSLRIFHCAFLLPGYNEEKTQKAKRGYRT